MPSLTRLRRSFLPPPCSPWPAVAAAAWLAASCAPSVSQPEDLEALVARVQELRAADDGDRLLELVCSLLPDEDDIDVLLTSEGGVRAFSRHCRYLGADTDHPFVRRLAAELFRPNRETQTEVRVHSATSAELQDWRQGSVAWREFPPQARAFSALSAPERRWWVVEQVAPEAAVGTRTSLFTRLGDRFVLLPEPWRWLRR